MPLQMTDDQVAQWLRNAEFDLRNVRDRFDSDLQNLSSTADEELEWLSLAVEILEPCRAAAMPNEPAGTRPQAAQPLRLTPALLAKIHLPPQDKGTLISDIVNPSKPISPAAEALIKKIEGRDAKFAETARRAFAGLAILRRRLQIRKGTAGYQP
jgi:hypothetical protein